MLLSGLAMGGAERNVVALLPQLRSQGADVALCTLDTRRDGALVAEFAGLGIERIDLSARRLLDWSAHRRLITVLQQRKIDLLHAQDQYAILAGAAAQLRTHVPYVITRHVLEEASDTWRRALRARLVFAAARHNADGIIAVSRAAAAEFSRQAHLPSSRIETIHNGLDIQKFDRTRRETIRAGLGWRSDQRIVAMVAVLRPGKGHEVLFEAARRLKQTVPNLRIVLVGGGPLADELRQAARPFDDTIEFLGERADVPDLLVASDALVLPSWSEALPTVLIEAAAAGLPVVAADVGGVPEIVEHGRTGWLFARGDTGALTDRLTHLLADLDAARNMGAAARQRAERDFAIERQARRTLDLYRRVLAA